jgi:hypothetical protein
MPIIWNAEQVIALAPDAASAKAGSALANKSKWVTLGCNDQTVWGECQGSGKNPYQTQIDLTEPAFNCSCPSRKFPCKHGLGLFLLMIAQVSAFTQKEPPAWVAEWVAKRQSKAEQRTKKEENKEKAPDPAAQVRRAEQRSKKVDKGVAELQQWMFDICRQGLAAVQTKPYTFWEAQAARLVDAQAAGLARMLRQMAGISVSGEGWQDRLLERLSRLQLLLEGYKRIGTLPEETQADIRNLIGWNPNQEELLAQAGTHDIWLVLGQRVYEEEKLRLQRTWLIGRESQKNALLLQFAFGQAGFEINLPQGVVIDAELIFFPSAYPQRVLVKSRKDMDGSFNENFGYTTVSEVFKVYGAALSCNPWLEHLPIALSSVTPLQQNGQWLVVDSEGKALTLSPRFEKGWELMAMSGGRSLKIFGEWNGEHLYPLNLWVAGKFIQLS